MNCMDHLSALRSSLYNMFEKCLFQKGFPLGAGEYGCQYFLIQARYYFYSVFQNQIVQYRDRHDEYGDRIYRHAHSGSGG